MFIQEWLIRLMLITLPSLFTCNTTSVHELFTCYSTWTPYEHWSVLHVNKVETILYTGYRRARGRRLSGIWDVHSNEVFSTCSYEQYRIHLLDHIRERFEFNVIIMGHAHIYYIYTSFNWMTYTWYRMVTVHIRVIRNVSIVCEKKNEFVVCGTTLGQPGS